MVIRVIKSVYNAYDILIHSRILYLTFNQYKTLKEKEEKENEKDKLFYTHYEKA